MHKVSEIEAFKKLFVNSLPDDDNRTVISTCDLIIGLAFCFLGDSKTFSIEAIRRYVIIQLQTTISKSAFWERIAGNPLKNKMKNLISELMKNISTKALYGKNLLPLLSIKNIYLVDSSSITLWDGAKKNFPGTRTHAGIKWHCCFDLFSGALVWFKTSPTKMHDSLFFPKLTLFKNSLVIFDLGYWDYKLLQKIVEAHGFFLSRIKCSANISIDGIIQGLPKKYIGEKLLSLNFKKSMNVIELIGSILSDGTWQSYRVIGFWNKKEKKYHWYVTNLLVSSKIIYTLYRLRWQIELIFKGCKQSLNIDEKQKSNNKNIIEILILSSVIATLATTIILAIGINGVSEKKKRSISFQKIYQVMALVAHDFINYLSKKNEKYKKILEKNIRLISEELFIKNHENRKTTLTKLFDELVCE